MSHLRLVHSVPNTSVLGHPCLDAFEAELDYLHESLRQSGAPSGDIEDLAHEVFLALHRSWPTYHPSRPFRPHLLDIALEAAGAKRGGLVTPIIPPLPEEVRARAIIRARAAIATGEVSVRAPQRWGRGRARTLDLAIAVCLAIAIGATGAAVALHGYVPSRSPANVTPPAEYSEPSANGASSAAVEALPRQRRVVPAVDGSTRPARGSTAARGSYAEELECLERAQRAFLGRDFDGALAAVAEHARRFPHGWLAEEREALRVRSLAGAGFTEEARVAAGGFGERFPRSVLLPHLRSAL